MKRNSFKRGGIQQRAAFWNKKTKTCVASLLVLGLAMSCFLYFSSRPLVETQRTVENESILSVVESSPENLSKADSALAAAEVAREIQTTARDDSTLIPSSVRLKKKILLEKEWNSGPDSLGRFTPRGEDGINEGAILGPTSVACIGDFVYVFDNNDPNKRRLAVYDADGRMISSVPLPGGLSWADLVVDPSDSSLFVIDHPLNKIYKVRDGQVSDLGQILLGNFSLGMRFGYDEESKTLYVRDREQNADIPVLINGRPTDLSERNAQTLSPVWGDFDPENNHNLLLNFKDGRNIRVAFDRAVESVDEMTMDQHGRVWVIFTLEWDYRVRRLAVVDPARNTAGVELLDMQFPYENIRRMAPSGNGIVIVSGNDENGLLRSYDLGSL